MKHRMQFSQSRLAYSLIELFIVMAICSILLALILVAVQHTRHTVARVSCASQLRQLAMAIHMYHDTHHHFPPGCSYPRTPNAVDYFPGMSWHTSILPYIEMHSLAVLAQTAYQNDPRGYTSPHAMLCQTIVPEFLCPAESRRISRYPEIHATWAHTSYMGIAGSSRHSFDGIFLINQHVKISQVSDGTSTTIMIGERPPQPDGTFSGWYSLEGHTICPLSQILGADDPILPGSIKNGCQFPPIPIPLRPGNTLTDCHYGHFWSLHSGGANFAFADGSVRFISYSVGTIVASLATRDAGEVIPIF